MGQIKEKVLIKNFGDILKYKEGQISKEKIRQVEVEAIVDTGAAFLCLPPKIIEELGLMYSHSRSVRTANGKVERRIFFGASITILNREIQMQVMENDQTTPPLIGYLVLENMDFVANPNLEKITGNPEHNGEWVVDLF